MLIHKNMDLAKQKLDFAGSTNRNSKTSFFCLVPQLFCLERTNVIVARGLLENLSSFLPVFFADPIIQRNGITNGLN